ncbi:uncharacterized protein LOC123007540 [Tribolium madens]|uniref:uncharacterized protein LOC123007540 n=1 Tax=Tribolium madens TaxID=41895 RepID=UPI001CF72946|nr:uncharacterized protein LOC123007540 [Tribolium madens]
MVPTSQIIILAIFLSISIISAQYSQSPLAYYQHEIVYGFSQTPEILPLAGSSGMPASVGFHEAGNPLLTPAILPVDLFTPNTEQQPAETPGQFRNYIKALEEEAKEAEKAENAITTTTLRDEIRKSADEPKGYVTFKMERGAKSYNYGYAL